MNPQKYSQHTALNHSILWRKSYSYEKPILQYKPNCHKQLNQLGQTGQSWRTRNNMIQTNNFSYGGAYRTSKSNADLKKGYSSFRVSRVLQNGKNQSTQTKNLKSSLVENANILQKSTKLIEAMQNLKQMKLLSNKDLQKIKYPGIIRHAHVYNDYHERVTNPGFSRNYAGKHFTK